MSGFSLHVKIFIDPSNVDKFFELFKPVYEQVIAEPECRFFEVYQSPDEPGTLSWVENWFVCISQDRYRRQLTIAPGLPPRSGSWR